MVYVPAHSANGDVRREDEGTGGGVAMRKPMHDGMRVDERADAIWIHIDIPPVSPDEVNVDITGGEIAVMTAHDIYCTIDVPLGVDTRRAAHSVKRGHLEIVLPKLA